MKHFGSPNSIGAFGRIDLIAVTVVLGVLGVGFYVFIGRSRASTNITVCASNLKQLGVAMAMYEKDNGGRLPYAFIRYGKASDYGPSKDVWDSLIFPLVPPGQNGLAQKHFLRCPADTLPGVQGQARRTYAMPSHSTRNENWPLSAQNATGVGVYWQWSFENKVLTNSIPVTRTRTNGPTEEAITVNLPAVKLDMIHAPESTLLLTENAWAENSAFNYHGATIDSTKKHVSTNLDIEEYHRGEINYLMVDGHVELLYPSESMGRADPRHDDPGKKFPNVWTIGHGN